MKTYSVKPADIKKSWVVIDAENKPLGRLASEISRILRGKHKATFVPHLDCGDNVVVLNAKKVKLTGRKMEQKVYYRHTNFIGGIKATSASELLDTYPERIIENAVKGMLPHNKLGRRVIKNMKVYAGSEHPHEAQKPVAAPLRLSKEG